MFEAYVDNENGETILISAEDAFKNYPDISGVIFYCPICDNEMCGKCRQGTPFFAHYPKKVCLGQAAKDLHSRAQDMLLENLNRGEGIYLPDGRMVFSKQAVKEFIKDQVRPDIAMLLNDGALFFVEVTFTNKTCARKRKLLREYGITTFEIDLSAYVNRTVSNEDLHELVMGPSPKKVWIIEPATMGSRARSWLRNLIPRAVLSAKRLYSTLHGGNSGKVQLELKLKGGSSMRRLKAKSSNVRKRQRSPFQFSLFADGERQARDRDPMTCP